MSVTTYTICPKCNKVQHKQTVAGDSTETERLRYQKGKPCEGGCKAIRTAKQKPPDFMRKR